MRSHRLSDGTVLLECASSQDVPSGFDPRVCRLWLVEDADEWTPGKVQPYAGAFDDCGYDYSPGHPWYGITGGLYPSADEVVQAYSTGDGWHAERVAEEFGKLKAKRSAKLAAAIDEARRTLDGERRRYERLRRHGPRIARRSLPYEARRPVWDWSAAVGSKYNHLRHSAGRLAAMLAFERGEVLIPSTPPPPAPSVTPAPVELPGGQFVLFAA